jgi:hypothetical protein
MGGRSSTCRDLPAHGRPHAPIDACGFGAIVAVVERTLLPTAVLIAHLGAHPVASTSAQPERASVIDTSQCVCKAYGAPLEWAQSLVSSDQAVKIMGAARDQHTGVVILLGYGKGGYSLLVCLGDGFASPSRRWHGGIRHAGGLSGWPVEFDRVVLASGNLAVRGKQFWLGLARAWITVTFPQSALNVSPGARAHYDQQRHRGLGHEPSYASWPTGWSASCTAA